MCVYTYLYFFLGFLGHQGEDTFHSEPWCWLARAPCSTGTFHQTHATNSTFPVQELRLFLLLYPQLLCLSVGSNKYGNTWCIWNVERLLFCRSFRLQPRPQNGLISDVAAVSPSSPCGTCTDCH